MYYLCSKVGIKGRVDDQRYSTGGVETYNLVCSFFPDDVLSLSISPWQKEGLVQQRVRRGGGGVERRAPLETYPHATNAGGPCGRGSRDNLRRCPCNWSASRQLSRADSESRFLIVLSIQASLENIHAKNTERLLVRDNI